jgi:hypothetical protein
MNNRITALCKTLIGKLLSSLKRFPEAILLAASVVSVLIYTNHFGFDLTADAREMLRRIAMTLALGIPVSLCMKTLFERMPALKTAVKALVYAGAAGGLLLYCLFLLKDFEMVSVTRYTAFSIALYLAFTFIPYFLKKDNYELYVIKLLTNFFITYLYSAVLFLGLAAMLFTINALFLLDISSKLYFDIWLIVAGVFAPAYFLADIPGHKEKVHQESFPVVFKVLLLYIVMPLLIAYSTILYVYFAKIVFTRQWPDGLVSHLVLWYSFAGILVLFFVFPLRKINRWVNTFVSFYPKLIIPLLAMMFVSMGIRINAYGITENRYFVMAAGLWVAGSFIYYIVKKDVRNILLPVSLALVAVLTVTGPWSAYGISRLSQNMRFENILERHEMIRDGNIALPSEDLSMEDKREISAIIRYFGRYHDLNDLKYLPDGFTTDQTEELFGFEYNYDLRGSNTKEYFRYYLTEDNMPIEIGDYDYFANFTISKHAGMDSAVGPVSVSYSADTKELQIMEEGQRVYSANLSELISRLYQNLDDNKPMNTGQMSYKDQTQNVKVLYVFKSINGWKDRLNDQLEVESVDFYIFVKIK